MEGLALVAFLAAYGDNLAAPRTDAMRKSALLVGLLVAGCSAPGSCDLAPSIEMGDTGVTRDCGTLKYVATGGPPPELEPYRVAHDCVLDATTTKTSFVVRWKTQYIDTSDLHALVGDSHGIHLLTEHRGHGAETTAQTCTDLVDLGTCDDASSSLCLTCAGASDESPCDSVD